MNILIITNRSHKSLQRMSSFLNENGYFVLNNRKHITLEDIIYADIVGILPDANYTEYGRDLINSALIRNKPILSRMNLLNEWHPKDQRCIANEYMLSKTDEFVLYNQ